MTRRLRRIACLAVEFAALPVCAAALMLLAIASVLRDAEEADALPVEPRTERR